MALSSAQLTALTKIHDGADNPGRAATLAVLEREGYTVDGVVTDKGMEALVDAGVVSPTVEAVEPETADGVVGVKPNRWDRRANKVKNRFKLPRHPLASV